MENAERRFSFGTYASGTLHVVLIAWLLLGWGLSAEPLPFEVTEVSVVSGAEYARIVAATTPQPGVDEPVAPDAPATDLAPVPDAPVEDVAPAQVAPDAPPPDTSEAPPDAPAPVDPPAQVTETAPDQPPQPLEQAIPDPTLEVALQPQVRPADRVAPEAVAPPPEDVPVAEVPQDIVVPDETAPPAEVVEEPVEQAAPEEATTEIVTEADEPATAPLIALRPPNRPERLVAAVEAPVAPAAEPAPEAPVIEQPDTTAAEDAAVEAALAAALAGSSEPVAAQGPPMTGSETESFRVAVNECWTVDAGSLAARVSVTVGFSLGRDGKVSSDVRLLSSDGGDGAAAEVAFEAARRAILRCQTFNGRNGYVLPDDKYAEWSEVQATFDPSGMLQ